MRNRLRMAWHWLRCIVGRHHPDHTIELRRSYGWRTVLVTRCELCGAEHHWPPGTVLPPSRDESHR